MMIMNLALPAMCLIQSTPSGADASGIRYGGKLGLLSSFSGPPYLLGVYDDNEPSTASHVFDTVEAICES